MVRGLFISLLFILINATASFAQDVDRITSEVNKVLDEFMRTFNANDAVGHYQTYHFPHYRLASGKMSVLEKPQHTALSYLRIQSDWHHSVWDKKNIVHLSADKVHVDTQFTRYRQDGTKIQSYESLYILTYENEKWAIKMRSSFAE